MLSVAYLRTAFSAGVILTSSFVVSSSPGIASDKSSMKLANQANYQNFREDVVTISALRLDKTSNLEQAKRLLVNYNEKELSRGAIAEFAAIAAGSGKFSSGLKKEQRRYGGRQKFVSALKANPNVVLGVSGWQDAARDVAGAALQDTARMQALAFRLNEIAYGRTAQEAKLASKGAGVTSASRPRRVKEPTALMVHVLAAGALMRLEKADSLAAKPVLASFAANKSHDQCLRWARLNISQCLAAAGTKEETAYCLSTQALGERTKCWSSLTQTGK